MERILMIGGDESVRDSLALTLEWAGYDVSEAASAREALAFHQQNPASVIVANDLDADEEGLEHIQALRSHSPTLPIITMSGTIPSSDQEQTSISHILGRCTAYKSRSRWMSFWSPFKRRFLVFRIRNPAFFFPIQRLFL